MEAMQSQTVDVVKRMKEITLVMQTPEEVLEAQGVTATDIEGLYKYIYIYVIYYLFICFALLQNMGEKKKKSLFILFSL